MALAVSAVIGGVSTGVKIAEWTWWISQHTGVGIDTVGAAYAARFLYNQIRGTNKSLEDMVTHSRESEVRRALRQAMRVSMEGLRDANGTCMGCLGANDAKIVKKDEPWGTLRVPINFCKRCSKDRRDRQHDHCIDIITGCSGYFVGETLDPTCSFADIEIAGKVYDRLCTVLDRNLNRPAKGIEIDAYMTVEKELYASLARKDWGHVPKLYLAAVAMTSQLPKHCTKWTEGVIVPGKVAEIPMPKIYTCVHEKGAVTEPKSIDTQTNFVFMAGVPGSAPQAPPERESYIARFKRVWGEKHPGVSHGMQEWAEQGTQCGGSTSEDGDAPQESAAEESPTPVLTDATPSETGSDAGDTINIGQQDPALFMQGFLAHLGDMGIEATATECEVSGSNLHSEREREEIIFTLLSSFPNHVEEAATADAGIPAVPAACDEEKAPVIKKTSDEVDATTSSTEHVPPEAEGDTTAQSPAAEVQTDSKSVQSDAKPECAGSASASDDGSDNPMERRAIYREGEALYGYSTVAGIDSQEAPPGLVLTEREPKPGEAAKDVDLKNVDIFKADQPEAGKAAEAQVKKVACRTTVDVEGDKVGHIAANTKDCQKHAAYNRHFPVKSMKYGTVGQIHPRMVGRIKAVTTKFMEQMDRLQKMAGKEAYEKSSGKKVAARGAWQHDDYVVEMETGLAEAALETMQEEAPYDHASHKRSADAIFTHWKSYMPKGWTAGAADGGIYWLGRKQPRGFFVKANEVLGKIKPRLIQKFGTVGGFTKVECKWLEDVLFGIRFFENRSVKHSGPKALRRRFKEFQKRFTDENAFFASMDYGSFDASQGFEFRSIVENQVIEHNLKATGPWTEEITYESMKQRRAEILRTKSEFWDIESDHYGRESGDSGTSVLNYISAIVAFLVQMCCESGLEEYLSGENSFKSQNLRGCKTQGESLTKLSEELYVEEEASGLLFEAKEKEVQRMLCTPFDLGAVNRWFDEKSQFDILEEGDDGLWALAKKWVKKLGGNLALTNRLVARAELIGFQLEPQSPVGRVDPGTPGLSSRKEHCSHIIQEVGTDMLRIPKLRKCHTSLAVSWSAGKVDGRDQKGIHRECATKALAMCANNIDSPLMFELSSMIFQRHEHAYAEACAPPGLSATRSALAARSEVLGQGEEMVWRERPLGNQQVLKEDYDQAVKGEHYSIDAMDRVATHRSTFFEIYDDALRNVRRFYENPVLMEGYAKIVEQETLGKIKSSELRGILDIIRGSDHTAAHKVGEVYAHVGSLLGNV